MGSHTLPTMQQTGRCETPRALTPLSVNVEDVINHFFSDFSAVARILFSIFMFLQDL